MGCASVDSDTVTDTGTVPDTYADMGTDVSTDTHADMGTDVSTDTHADVGMDTAIDTITDTATDTITDTATDTIADTATDTTTDTATDTIADTATDTIADTTTDTVTDTDADSTTCHDVLSAFSFDFETGGCQGWTIGHLTSGGCSTANEWECGVPSSSFWPYAAATGTSCMATDLNDMYYYDSCAYTMSPALDLTPCVGQPVCLELNLAYDLVEMWDECYDSCVIQVNDTDDPAGDNWVTIAPDGGYPYPVESSHHLEPDARAFCGQADWSTYTFPVDDALKKSAFRVRVYMDIGDVNIHFGSYVDDVRLVDCP
jgi:hypothetical protein